MAMDCLQHAHCGVLVQHADYGTWHRHDGRRPFKGVFQVAARYALVRDLLVCVVVASVSWGF